MVNLSSDGCASSSASSRARTSFGSSVNIQNVVRLCAVILLVIGPWACAGAQTSDPPIKVHGGAGTFFTRDKHGWVPLPGKKDTFCTSISAFDLNQVHVSGFYSASSLFRTKDAQNGRVIVNPGNWRVEFLGHAPEDTIQFRAQPQGIVLQASQADCNDATGGRPSVRISPLAGATFYSKDLPATQTYPGNKRFRSTCKGEEADLCERVAEIKVFPSNDLRDTKRPALTLDCPDGACTVYIGELRLISLKRLVRVIPIPEPPRPAAR